MSALDVFTQFQAAFDAALPPDRPAYVEPSAAQVEAKAHALQAEWMQDDDKLTELLFDGSWGVPSSEVAAAIRSGNPAALGALLLAAFRQELASKSKDAAADALEDNA